MASKIPISLTVILPCRVIRPWARQVYQYVVLHFLENPQTVSKGFTSNSALHRVKYVTGSMTTCQINSGAWEEVPKRP